MDAHGGGVRARGDRRRVDVEAWILLLPFRSAVLEPERLTTHARVRRKKKERERFTDQILTCVSVRDNESARFSRSHTDRYRVCLNLFSRATSCS